jgi:serine/threonine-protein kinase
MLVPPGWQRQPADPNWPVEQYFSPDGTGSFSAYITPVAQEPIAQHMKTVAFVDGEQITRLRGERSWIEVSGFKGDRVFYRKSVLACGGTSWHEIVFEYPTEADGMKVFVDRAAKAVETNLDKGCPASVATSNASSNAGEQPPAGAQ